MSYYSIYIPTKNETELCDRQFVFTEIEEALKVLKNHKEGRLKVFKIREDADNYAQTGYEDYQPKLHLKSPSAALEKAAFRAPTKQELVLFRKAIEEDKYEVVRAIIWENPRYLVNSGDTPTSLKEGTRYNALHVCAIHKRAKIAEFILQTISTVFYIEMLHGKKNPKICQEVSEILLDYYLNMPEKGRSETPLHLAAKYGAVEVIEVLTAYPQCKMTPNLENLLPKDIICSRMGEPSAELKSKIACLLEERFYVPVIRSVDNSVPPTIGDLFSPTNPPKFSQDPLSPDLEIQAYAGPMNKEQAQSFRRRWKTPPRVGATGSNIVNSPYATPVKIRSRTPTKTVNNNSSPSSYGKISFYSNKSVEINNLEDTQNANYSNETTPIVEYENNNKAQHQKLAFTLATPLRKNPLKRDLFFTYRDKGISPLIFDNNDSGTSNNSEILEKDVCDSPGWKERHLKLTDTEKGLELIGRELAKENKVEWKEYWDFLGCFIDISSADGLDKLETYLAQRKTLYEKSIEKSKEQCLMNNLCNALDQLGLCKEKIAVDRFEANKPKVNPVTQSTHFSTSYLCVEKSLQVFAKRMTKTILNNIESVVSINDTLNSELKRLKSLICSFKDDERFLLVNFRVVHSRLAKLIVDYLKESTDMNPEQIMKIRNNFMQIVESKQKADKGKSRLDESKDVSEDQRGQLHCVSEFILKDLNVIGDRILPENLKTEEICEVTWKGEIICNCTWDSESNRQSSRKKRIELMEVSKKLFDTNDSTSHSSEKRVIEKYKDCNAREKISVDSTDTFSEVIDDEEDVFWSDFESENEEEIFYTPPDSPSILEYDISDDDCLESYNTYLLGNEPTKRDLDVLNALFNVTIDKNTYPNIHRWRAAVLRHPIEERDNFSSPSVIVKGRKEFHRPDDKLLVAKRLFMSPKFLSDATFDHLRFENDRIDSPVTVPGVSASKNLSFMNVSDI